ncbi:MAG TPA: EamA family transporter [Chthoniobacterales bacterium]
MTNNWPTGFRNPWFQFVLNIIGVVVYELLLKAGASATADPARGWSGFGVTALLSPLTWLAICVIIVDLTIWLYILRYIPLSIAFPLSRTVDVLVPISCWLILKEAISPMRWFGIALAIIGLVIIAKPAAQLEERL